MTFALPNFCIGSESPMLSVGEKQAELLEYLKCKCMRMNVHQSHMHSCIGTPLSQEVIDFLKESEPGVVRTKL